MISDDTRLNALIRVMTIEQKERLIEAAKDILSKPSRQIICNTGGMNYAQNNPRNED